MPAAEPGAAVTADRVDLVDEHDRGRCRLRLLEQVAHARRADADEHLDEVGAADREERHAGLAGDGLGEQRLAGAGRAEEQHALRDLGAHSSNGRVDARNSLISSSSSTASSSPATSANVTFGWSLLTRLGLRLAEAHHAAPAALHLAEQDDDEHEDEHERQQAEQEADQRVLAAGGRLESLGRLASRSRA